MLGQGVLHACISIILAACVFYVITRLRKIDEHIHQLYRSLQDKVSAPDVIGIVHSQMHAHQASAVDEENKPITESSCPVHQPPSPQSASQPEPKDEQAAPPEAQAAEDAQAVQASQASQTTQDSEDEYNVVEKKKEA